MNRSRLTLLAAVARNGAIGKNNDLVWREPEDLRHLRRVTTGHAVLMGRKTWDSLPPKFRPLPNRRNVVLTRDPTWRADGADTATTLDDALALLAGSDQVFVLGGAEIYALAMPRADRLVLTEVDADLDGDTFFPPWDRDAYACTARDVRDGYSFVTYERKAVAA